MVTHPLDNPVFAALTGEQATFAVRHGNAIRYRPDVSPFCAVADESSASDWAEAARLTAPGQVALFVRLSAGPPADWEIVAAREGVQLVADDLDPAADPEAVALTAADVPEMLELTERTKPGPFLHAAGDNVNAIRLYKSLGFTHRREVTFVATRPPRVRPQD